jgi:hypothetical protein
VQGDVAGGGYLLAYAGQVCANFRVRDDLVNGFARSRGACCRVNDEPNLAVLQGTNCGLLEASNLLAFTRGALASSV